MINILVFQSKSPTGLMLHVVQYSAQNKISMASMSMSMIIFFFIGAYPYYCLESSVGRECAFRAGGRGFESHACTIPKV